MEMASHFVSINVCQLFVDVVRFQFSVDVVVFGYAPYLLLSQAVKDLGDDCLLFEKFTSIDKEFFCFSLLVGFDCLLRDICA